MQTRSIGMAWPVVLALLTAASPRLPAQAVNAPRTQDAGVAKAAAGADGPAEAARMLVEALQAHPARPSTVADRSGGLFVLDIAGRRTTPIAEETDPGVAYCGSPDWSRDGRRILFDAMKADDVAHSHLKVISVAGGRPKTTDLGIGNCPTFSPDGRRIAYLQNIEPQPGVWVMLAGGAERKALGSYGRPRWSPDGRQMLITSFSTPGEVTIMDASPDNSGVLQVADQQVHSVPTWADNHTLVAVIGSNDTIALIDTTTPAEGKVKEILWKKGKDLDVTPSYPTYSAATREYVFVGEGPGGMALYAFRPGQPGPPRALEPGRHDKLLRDPTFSPDGRYLVFTSDRLAGPRPETPAKK